MKLIPRADMRQSHIDVLEAKIAALEAQNAAALEAQRATEDFLACMSHEIRTLLNGVLGYLHMLQERVVQPDERVWVDKALVPATSMLRLVNDILDFSKLKANALTLERIDFSLRERVYAVIASLHPLARQQSTTLRLNIASGMGAGMDARWQGDPVRFSQILTNLIGNAVKFTPRGQVTVRLWLTTLDVTRVNDDAHACANTPLALCMDICDTGVGMSKKALATVFDRYKQAERCTTRAHGGTGLGLAITRDLVQLMQGTIAIDSVKGVGTTVRLVLPRMPLLACENDDDNDDDGAGVNDGHGDSECATRVNNLSSHTGAPNLTGMTILIADDNAINLELLAFMLAPTNATVVSVTDGAQAISAVKQHAPAIIFMDIHMPVMDGVAACETLRLENVAVPIIAFTANVMKDEVTHYLQCGFSAHLGKPLLPEALYQCLRAQLVSLFTEKSPTETSSIVSS